MNKWKKVEKNKTFIRFIFVGILITIFGTAIMLIC